MFVWFSTQHCTEADRDSLNIKQDRKVSWQRQSGSSIFLTLESIKRALQQDLGNAWHLCGDKSMTYSQMPWSSCWNFYIHDSRLNRSFRVTGTLPLSWLCCGISTTAEEGTGSHHQDTVHVQHPEWMNRQLYFCHLTPTGRMTTKTSSLSHPMSEPPSSRYLIFLKTWSLC